jgi:PAS domain S-box-containing protein
MKIINKQAFKIALIFLVISFLWILYSDNVLLSLFDDDPEKLTHLQTYKGWFYVFTASFIIYFLVMYEIKKKAVFDEKAQLVLQKKIEEYVTLNREHEEKYRSLFENEDDAIFIMKDGNFVDCNSRTLDMFGCTKDQIIGKSPIDFSPEYQSNGEKSKKFILEIINTVLTGSKVSFEWKHKRLNGNLFDTDVTLNTIELNNEKYLQAAIRDISNRKKADEKLKEREERYRTHYTNMPILTYIWKHENNDFILVEYNNAAKAATKGTMRNLIGKKVSIIYKDKKDIITDINKCYKNKMLIQKEINYKSKETNEEKRIYITYIFIPPGNVVMHTEDITELKKTVELLTQREKNFQHLVSNTFDGIFVYNCKGDYLYANNRALEICGYSIIELLHLNVSDLTPDYARNILHNSVVQQFEGNKDHIYVEIQLLKKNGKEIPIEASASKIIWYDQPAQILSLRDITKRKESEKALIVSEEKFRNIFNYSTDGIVITDKNQKILTYNQTLIKMLGYSVAQGKGKKVTDFIIPKDVKIVQDRMKRLFKFKLLQSVELSAFNTSGKIIPIEVNSKIIEYENQNVNLSIIRDITERKEVERKILNTVIETEERERKRFASDLHDDIGPLLSSIKMLVNVLHDTKNQQKKRVILSKSYEVINTAIASIREISNNISPHLLNNFGLNTALSSFCNKINLGKDIQIEFESNIADFRFDRNQEVTLYRIFIELLNNTIKHSKAKHVKIDLNSSDEKLICYYKDDGIGFIVSQQLNKLDKGLGLNNIIHRIESINGKCKIESKPKGGMRVILQVVIDKG